MSKASVVISVVVALALAVAAYFALGPVRPSAGRAAAAGGPALPFSPADVAVLAVTSPDADANRPARVARSLLLGGWALWPDGAPESAAWPVRASNMQGALRVLNDLRTAAGPVAEVGFGGGVRLTLHSGRVWEVRFDPATVAGVRRATVIAPDGTRMAATCEAAVAEALLRPGPRGWREDLAFPAMGPELESIVLQSGVSMVRLDRAGAGWVVSAPVAASAEASAVADLIRSVSAIRVHAVPEYAPGASPPDDANPVASIQITEARRVGEESVRLRRTLGVQGSPGGLAGLWTKSRLEVSTVNATSSAAHSGSWAWNLSVDTGTVARITAAPEAYISRTAWAGDLGSVGSLEITPTGSTHPTLTLRRGLDGWSNDGAPLNPAVMAHPGEIVTLLTTRKADRVEFAPEHEVTESATLRVCSLGGAPLFEAALALTAEPDRPEVRVSTHGVRRIYLTGDAGVKWLLDAAAQAGPPSR